MSQSIRLRVAAGTLALVAGLATLTACGGDGTDEKTAAPGTGTTVATGDSEVTVETSEGAATVGHGLPDGFPRDIPLADEKVLSGTKGSAGGPFAWSVVMQSSRSVEELTAGVTKEFASWTTQEGSGTALGDVSILHFANDRYDVGVTIARSEDKTTVTYVVKDAG